MLWCIVVMGIRLFHLSLFTFTALFMLLNTRSFQNDVAAFGSRSLLFEVALLDYISQRQRPNTHRVYYEARRGRRNEEEEEW